MRKLTAFLLAAALAAVAALAGPALARPQRSVTVGDDYFVRKGTPPRISVRKGTRVTWRWSGNSLHNVNARTGPVKFHSGYKRSGTYSKILRRAGKYVIYCDIHAPDMKMTIRVG